LRLLTGTDAVDREPQEPLPPLRGRMTAAMRVLAGHANGR
jgi:hypothetical protein